MLGDTSLTVPRSNLSSGIPSSSRSLGFAVIRTFTCHLGRTNEARTFQFTRLLLATANPSPPKPLHLHIGWSQRDHILSSCADHQLRRVPVCSIRSVTAWLPGS